MPKYRRKPEPIDAWQWLGGNKEQEPLSEWVCKAVENWPGYNTISRDNHPEDGPRLLINAEIALVGDWIVRNEKGDI